MRRSSVGGCAGYSASYSPARRSPAWGWGRRALVNIGDQAHAPDSFADDVRVVPEHVHQVWWRRALWRARRIVFSPLWWLSWPLRAAMPRMMTRAYAKILAPGERVLAVDVSLGRSAEDYWIVTTRSVYIFPTPSRANERAGRTRGRRIPFSAISGISEIERGAFVERTMDLIPDVDGTAEVITELFDTTFKCKVAAAIERQLNTNTGKDWQPDGQ